LSSRPVLQLLSFLLCRASMTRICGKPSNETVRSVVSHLSCCMRIWCRRILSRALSIPAFPHPQLLSSGPGALSALHTRYLITGTFFNEPYTVCCTLRFGVCSTPDFLLSEQQAGRMLKARARVTNTSEPSLSLVPAASSGSRLPTLYLCGIRCCLYSSSAPSDGGPA